MLRLISPVAAPMFSLVPVDPAVELIADSGTDALEAEPEFEVVDDRPLAEAPLPREPMFPPPELPMLGVGGGGVIAIRGCEVDPALGFAVRSNDAPVEYPLPVPP